MRGGDRRTIQHREVLYYLPAAWVLCQKPRKHYGEPFQVWVDQVPGLSSPRAGCPLQAIRTDENGWNVTSPVRSSADLEVGTCRAPDFIGTGLARRYAASLRNAGRSACGAG